MSTLRFKADSIQDETALAEYVEAVKKGFLQGELTLTQGNESFAVKPRGLITFSVEGKAKGADRKLKLTFRWKEKDPAESPDEDQREPPLIIHS